MGRLFLGYESAVAYLGESRPDFQLGKAPIHLLKKWVRLGHLAALVQTPDGRFVPIAEARLEGFETAGRTHFKQESLDTIEKPPRVKRRDKGVKHGPKFRRQRNEGMDVTAYSTVKYRRKHRAGADYSGMGLVHLSPIAGGVREGWYEVGPASSFGAGTVYDFMQWRDALSNVVHGCRARDIDDDSADFALLLTCEGKGAFGARQCKSLSKVFDAHPSMLSIGSREFIETYAKWGMVFAFASNGGAVVIS